MTFEDLVQSFLTNMQKLNTPARGPIALLRDKALEEARRRNDEFHALKEMEANRDKNTFEGVKK